MLRRAPWLAGLVTTLALSVAAEACDLRDAVCLEPLLSEIVLAGPTTNGLDSPAPAAPIADRRGLRGDTIRFVGYQIGAIGILYLAPESVSGWSDEQKDEYSPSRWWYNVTNPDWDEDDLFINYVTHPYWGAAYYVRARERGYGDRAAIAYSALMSATYEFGAEALFERASIQDLITTPLGGAILGRFFQRWRTATRERYGDHALPWRQRVAMTLTDPLGAINRRVDDWFGLEGRLTVRPQRYRAALPGPGGTVESELVYGVSFTLRW